MPHRISNKDYPHTRALTSRDAAKAHREALELLATDVSGSAHKLLEILRTHPDCATAAQSLQKSPEEETAQSRHRTSNEFLLDILDQYAAAEVAMQTELLKLMLYMMADHADLGLRERIQAEIQPQEEAIRFLESREEKMKRA